MTIGRDNLRRRWCVVGSGDASGRRTPPDRPAGRNDGGVASGRSRRPWPRSTQQPAPSVHDSTTPSPKRSGPSSAPTSSSSMTSGFSRSAPTPPKASTGLVDVAYERRSVAVSSNLHPSGFDQLMDRTIATGPGRQAHAPRPPRPHHRRLHPPRRRHQRQHGRRVWCSPGRFEVRRRATRC